MNQRHLTVLTICLGSLPALAYAAGPTPRLVSLQGAASTADDLSAIRYIQDEYSDRGPSTLMMWNSSAEAIGGPARMDEPLSSDRPDFTEASNTVGRGVIQVEMGFTYFQDTDGPFRTDSYSFPETLLRIGVFADWLELRMAWNYGQESLSVGPFRFTAAGSQDLYLGLKLGLTPQQGIFPEMSLVPQMTVPLGSVFSADEVLPGLNWLYGWEISEFLTMGGSTQVNLRIDGFAGKEYVEFAQSLTIGYGLTEKLGAYTEWFVLAPAGADFTFTEHYFDAGFTYSVTNNLQLDIRAGVGLSAASTDFFSGTGLVARF